MRKTLNIVFAIAMVAIVGFAFIGCSKSDSSDANTSSDVKRIAMVTDPVGTNPFLTQVVDKLAEMKEEGTYPIEYSVIECADSNAWAENIRAAVEEDYDMILGVGWQAADPLNDVATLFPDKAEYVCIDTVCDNPNVKSYIFRPQEGAFLIGAIAALVSAEEGAPTGPFGGVHANPGQSSFEWRWGYMEGARAINPEIQIDDFIFNYTSSYSDAPKAKELALQQAAQGCVFINAASANADHGTFEAAKEKGFYTSGQDADRTSPDNPYVLTTQIKYTGQVTEYAVIEMFETGIQPGVVSLGIKEGAIGAVYITDNGTNPRNPILTDEMVKTVRGYADKISSGELVLEVPMEADYK